MAHNAKASPTSGFDPLSPRFTSPPPNSPPPAPPHVVLATPPVVPGELKISTQSVPDPFNLDDTDEPISEDDVPLSRSAAASPRVSLPPSPSMRRTSIDIVKTSPHAPTVNLKKDQPPLPERDEPDVPALHLPSLQATNLFLPIPNTDPLTTLLTKYVPVPEMRPVRDLTGDWQHADVHTLVMTNSWRALARMAYDRITAAHPSEVNLILELWNLRLSCLARLRLFNQTSAECTNLFSVLSSIESPQQRTYVFDRLLPFDLEVMRTRLKYWASDYYGYLDSLHFLMKRCRYKARTNPQDVEMWKERASRVSLIIASQLLEMKQTSAAVKVLEPLCDAKDGSYSLRSAVARIYLQSGDIASANRHFALVEADPNVDEGTKEMNRALQASAKGDWAEAIEILRGILERDTENVSAANNLAVSMLNAGRLQEAINLLEHALEASPSLVVVAEPFIFNLATLYELRSGSAFEKKRQLLIEVAKWSGDGLKTTCLKLPSA